MSSTSGWPVKREVDLKPCPFCGGESVMLQTGKKQLTIKCKSCVIHYHQKVLRNSLEWLESVMVKTWNERVEVGNEQ